MGEGGVPLEGRLMGPKGAARSTGTQNPPLTPAELVCSYKTRFFNPTVSKSVNGLKLNQRQQIPGLAATGSERGSQMEPDLLTHT